MAHLRTATVALTLLLLAALVAGTSTLTAPVSAKETGITGVTSGCFCHSSAAADDVQVHIEGLPEKFRAHSTHELTVRIEGGPEVTQNSSNQGGFNLRADAGELQSVEGDGTVVPSNACPGGVGRPGKNGNPHQAQERQAGQHEGRQEEGRSGASALGQKRTDAGGAGSPRWHEDDGPGVGPSA